MFYYTKEFSIAIRFLGFYFKTKFCKKFENKILKETKRNKTKQNFLNLVCFSTILNERKNCRQKRRIVYIQSRQFKRNKRQKSKNNETTVRIMRKRQNKPVLYSFIWDLLLKMLLLRNTSTLFFVFVKRKVILNKRKRI